MSEGSWRYAVGSWRSDKEAANSQPKHSPPPTANSPPKDGHLSMKLLFITAALLISLDAGIKYWRSSAPTSSAPVWSLDVAEEEWGNTEGIRTAIRVYSADRGMERTEKTSDGLKLTTFYFEWDQVEVGPMMDLVGHNSEECNVVAGFEFDGHLPHGSYTIPGDDTLEFDAVRFREPSGRPVYVYKAAWIQGLGPWDLREGHSRRTRLMRTLDRGYGAARALQCGVWGAPNEPTAWKAFSKEILRQIHPARY